MFLNIFMLSITTLVLYIGYTYKAIILLIFTLVLDEIYKMFDNYKTPSTTRVEDGDKKVDVIRFKHNEKRYVLNIPLDTDKTFRLPKIMALDGCSNKTNILLEAMGPHMNFFGYMLTPNDLGCETLLVWVDRVRYAFENKDCIVFDNVSKNRVLISELENSSDVSDTSDITEE